MTTAPKCKNCGKPFSLRRGGGQHGGSGKPQVHCSDACRRAYATKAVYARRFAARSTTCEECGETFDQSPVGAPKRFCSPICKRRYHNRRQQRARLAIAVPLERACLHCGKMFHPKRSDSSYCYDGWCVQAAYQARKRNGAAPRMVERELTCDGCGTKFTAKHPRARWCSRACAGREKSRRAAKRARQVVPGDYSDRSIFERDGWRCYLCGKKINRKLKWPDEGCATIDHVTPVALGGTDEESNVAAAHWSCNRKKRATVVDQQLRLGLTTK